MDGLFRRVDARRLADAQEAAQELARLVMREELGRAGVYNRDDEITLQESLAAVDADPMAALAHLRNTGVGSGMYDPDEPYYSQARVNAMADSIATGEPDEDASRWVSPEGRGDLLDVGRLDSNENFGELEGQGFPPPETWEGAAEAFKGQDYLPDAYGDRGNLSVADVYGNQRKGWDGYGWTEQKIQQLGRNPEPRELSSGGRRAWTASRNARLLRGLAGQNETLENPPQNMLGLAEGNIYPGMPAADEGRRATLLSALTDDWTRTRGSPFGESGFLGAMQNTEYPVGYAANNWFQPFPDAFWDAEVHRDQNTDRNFAGSLADAAVLADIRDANFRVEPILPAGTSPAEGMKILRTALIESGGPNFDQLFRKKTGFEAPYALSTAATLGNGLLDPSIVLTGPAAGLTNRAAKALATGARAAQKYAQANRLPVLAALAKPLRRYGSHIRGQTNWARKFPLIGPAQEEMVEEGVLGGGLMGGAYAQRSEADYGPKEPGPADWWHPGGRTDRYIPDPQTGEFRPQTQSENDAAYNESFEKADAVRRRWENAIAPAIKMSQFPQ